MGARREGPTVYQLGAEQKAYGQVKTSDNNGRSKKLVYSSTVRSRAAAALLTLCHSLNFLCCSRFLQWCMLLTQPAIILTRPYVACCARNHRLVKPPQTTTNLWPANRCLLYFPYISCIFPSFLTITWGCTVVL